MKTRTDKMYAIGDIREKDVRQIATATNDGVIATTFILKEILKSKKNKILIIGVSYETLYRY